MTEVITQHHKKMVSFLPNSAEQPLPTVHLFVKASMLSINTCYSLYNLAV